MKNYEDTVKRKKIEAVVSCLTIPNKFKPYVTDVLLRRAYQFEFTDEQLQTDLDTISYSLKDITIKKMNWLGEYNQIDKTIGINFKTMFFRTEKIFHIFAHEVFHSLTFNRDFTDRLAGINTEKNKYSGENNSILREMIVERGSNKCVFCTIQEDEYSALKTDGYPHLTYTIDMITSTFGITEQDFLKHGVQSRKELADFLALKANVAPEKVVDFLDAFEMNLAIIYRIAGNAKIGQYDYDKEQEDLFLAFENMGKVCMDMLAERIKNIPESDLTEERVEGLKYNYNRILFFVYKNEKENGKYDDGSNKLIDESFSITRKLIEERDKTYNRTARIDKKISNRPVFEISTKTVDRTKEPLTTTGVWDNSKIRTFKKDIYTYYVQQLIKKIHLKIFGISHNLFVKTQELLLDPGGQRKALIEALLLDELRDMFAVKPYELSKKNRTEKIEYLANKLGVDKGIVEKYLDNIVKCFNNITSLVGQNWKNPSENATNSVVKEVVKFVNLRAKFFREKLKIISWENLSNEQIANLKQEYNRIFSSSIIIFNKIAEFPEYKENGIFNFDIRKELKTEDPNSDLSISKRTIRDMQLLKDLGKEKIIKEFGEQEYKIIVNSAIYGVLFCYDMDIQETKKRTNLNMKSFKDIGIVFSREYTIAGDIFSEEEIKPPNIPWQLSRVEQHEVGLKISKIIGHYRSKEIEGKSNKRENIQKD